jgi:hypothetical protein
VSSRFRGIKERQEEGLEIDRKSSAIEDNVCREKKE